MNPELHPIVALVSPCQNAASLLQFSGKVSAIIIQVLAECGYDTLSLLGIYHTCLSTQTFWSQGKLWGIKEPIKKISLAFQRKIVPSSAIFR